MTKVHLFLHTTGGDMTIQLTPPEAARFEEALGYWQTSPHQSPPLFHWTDEHGSHYLRFDAIVKCVLVTDGNVLNNVSFFL